MGIIGQPVNRTDGRQKVTGGARYSAEHSVARLAHAVLVTSTVPKGRILAIEAGSVQDMPGVLLVLSHLNAQKLPEGGQSGADMPPAGRVLNLLQDASVHYNNQPVAVVVADTLEQARAAAQRLRIRYQTMEAALDFELAKRKIHPSEKVKDDETDEARGDLLAGVRAGAAQVDAVYGTPMEHHNPMEPHATIAAWDGDRLTLYDSTQYVTGVRNAVARRLGIAPGKVRVICPYVGGGFGCKGSVWSHVVLAAMAARQVGRPVKLALERPQLFGPVGGRPRTEQRLLLAADGEGRLAAIRHNVISSTSIIEDWMESSAIVSSLLYACPNLLTTQRLARLNLGTPTFMRAPGESTGSFALESALDELAYRLNMDPVQLRIRNHADQDPRDGKPWSSKSLLECYRVGAERFGWSRRAPQPRAMRCGHMLIGMGMATASFSANRSRASASARMQADGSAIVRSGSQDLGTGTYTVMTQVAADALGLPIEKVRFELGDTDLPQAPVSGGSQSVASVAPAVQAAALALRGKLIDMALADRSSPLCGARRDDITIAGGWLMRRSDPARREPLAALIARHDARQGSRPVEASATAEPGREKKKYSMHSFGAVFVEAHVDEDLGEIRIPRIVGVYGVGNLLNAKTARSQLMGGIVWGQSMALLEKTEFDQRYGRAVNANLAEYHVPVNADVGHIDVTVLDEQDAQINPLGAKGVGEIGITGVAAAIANAVYHATGTRVRDLPITLDKLLHL